VRVRATAVTLSIAAGTANALPDFDTLSLDGGGAPATADAGYLTLGSGVLETVGNLSLNGLLQPPAPTAAPPRSS
jgi:hypothetical protein